ncbi:unnamed protein product [Pieris brassicae]|uniref:Uncharacterized protein n=1 Tax=Pieris brassicae TaxID=7116 RepID=A0A9P0XBB7_PIEBR|nr:unnamed protein product [Pieris brassicae]
MSATALTRAAQSKADATAAPPWENQASPAPPSPIGPPVAAPLPTNADKYDAAPRIASFLARCPLDARVTCLSVY